MERTELSALVLADLESILELTRTAYLQRMPRLRSMSPSAVDGALEATRRAMKQFLRYYVEGTLDTEGWGVARTATISRAGEVFSYAEILEMLDIARGIAIDVVEHLAERHPELTVAERAEVASAVDRYLEELGEQEDRLRQLITPDNLDAMLAALEEEGADLG